MRTLVAAADPPPRRPADGYSFTRGNRATGTTTDAVFAWMLSEGITVNPWQAVVIGQTYDRLPIRVRAHVGEPVREIED